MSNLWPEVFAVNTFVWTTILANVHTIAQGQWALEQRLQALQETLKRGQQQE